MGGVSKLMGMKINVALWTLAFLWGMYKMFSPRVGGTIVCFQSDLNKCAYSTGQKFGIIILDIT